MSANTMNTEEREQYVQEIESTKAKYYQEHNKNRFFKNSQKLECATSISQEMDIQKMIKCTVFQVPDTNILYYNYLVFKTYANGQVTPILYQYVVALVDKVLKEYSSFEFHVNLKSFTISAAQRYYSIICSVFDDNTAFTGKMTRLVIYHTPSVINNIRQLLYNSIKDIVDKVEYFYKDSDTHIAKLFDISS
jgi:hypothetical protein